VSPLRFFYPARIVRIIDGDTAIVDPSVYPMDTYQRVRFKDAWLPELNAPDLDIRAAAEEAKRQAEAEFPVGAEVIISNERLYWTFGRIEARVDHKEDFGG
jgi:hypothetical protein